MARLTADVLPIDTAPKSLGAKLATLLRGSKVSGKRNLHHLETLSLGPKRSVYLVECEGERFLIAAGGEHLSAPVPLTQRFAMRASAEGDR
jgi:hypothetical protein